AGADLADDGVGGDSGHPWFSPAGQALQRLTDGGHPALGVGGLHEVAVVRLARPVHDVVYAGAVGAHVEAGRAVAGVETHPPLLDLGEGTWMTPGIRS